ncbi:MAG: hypothetical protein Q8M24_22500 [Pseudolabrys sp.]|nr:hypothetical protein [Pseudolabrys sp.]MDP2298224.1 hypothetical protein [Pseudolabrys sp.]
MTAIISDRLRAEKLGSDKSGPERYAPDRRPADKPASERPAAERLPPERLAQERLAPERLAPERLSPERLGDIDQAAANAFEGEIREFVRRDNAVRRPRGEIETVGDPVADNLNALIRRVSGASMEEIDRVILELQSVRDMLRQEGDRVSREVAGYASLSHAAMTAMSVIADSLTQWKGEPPKPVAQAPTPNQGQRTAG